MKNVEEIKRMFRRNRRKGESLLVLGSGSTLVNLACTGTAGGAFLAGHYYLIVGDSMSGKTWLGLSCFAEASIDRRFDNYRLIYDPVEGGALMDLERFFGKAAADRIEVRDPPSETVEEFYYNLDDDLRGDRPAIVVLDSQDSLSSSAEREKFGETKRAHRKGKEAAGSYGDNKAKVHSANLRKMMGPLRDTGSILIVLNQTRDSFDLFKPKTYSGGRALLFYATVQLWNKVKEQIRRPVRGKKRQLGVLVQVLAKKSRVTGRERSVLVPIYHSHGIDDTGSMVDFLVDEGEWQKSGAFVEASGLGPIIKARKDDLIRKVEEDDLVDDLRALVQRMWDEVERDCEVRRKKRYE